MKSLYQLRTELTVTQGRELLLRGKRLVVPASLQQKVVGIAHEGHQGMVKTKALLREKVWFPTIDKMVKAHHSRVHSLSSHNHRQQP